MQNQWLWPEHNPWGNKRTTQYLWNPLVQRATAAEEKKLHLQSRRLGSWHHLLRAPDGLNSIPQLRNERFGGKNKRRQVPSHHKGSPEHWVCTLPHAVPPSWRVKSHFSLRNFGAPFYHRPRNPTELTRPQILYQRNFLVKLRFIFYYWGWN